MDKLKMLIWVSNPNGYDLILDALGMEEALGIDSAYLTDLSFEDSELIPPDGEGLWIYDGWVRFEGAESFGAEPSDGGTYLRPHPFWTAEEIAKYPAEWRRPTADELYAMGDGTWRS